MRTLCTLFTTLLLIVPAFAEEEGGKPEKEKPAPNPHSNFKAAKALADTDKDGAISADEIAAVANVEIQTRLRSFDADADGALKGAEIEAAMKGWRPAKEGKEKKPNKDKAEAPAEMPAP